MSENKLKNTLNFDQAECEAIGKLLSFMNKWEQKGHSLFLEGEIKILSLSADDDKSKEIGIISNQKEGFFLYYPLICNNQTGEPCSDSNN